MSTTLLRCRPAARTPPWICTIHPLTPCCSQILSYLHQKHSNLKQHHLGRPRMNLETLPASLQLPHHLHPSHPLTLGISLSPSLRQFPPLSRQRQMSGVFQSRDLQFCHLLQELLFPLPSPRLFPISPPLPLLPLSSLLPLPLFTLPPLPLSEWKSLLFPQSSSTSLTGNCLG